MNTAVAINSDLRRARRAFAWVGLIAPILIASASVALMLAWLPDLPDRITTHWGPEGPDGYAAPVILVWMQLGISLAVPLLISVPILLMMRSAWGPVCRFLAAMSLGTAGLIAIASVGSVAVQRESVDVGFGIGPVIAMGLTAMVVLGVIGWFVQPKVSVSSGPDAGPVAQLRLQPGERAAWFAAVAMSRAAVIILVSAVLLLIVTTVWVAILEPSVWWICAIVTVLLVALISVTLVFRVRVNSAGLRVRSVAGWPRWDIAASEITDVKVVQVNPLAEFGGWGLRIAADGRMGVVLRAGEALQVTRTTGRAFVVTIDDARTAASVLITATKGSTS